mmetsp:Transcript_19515/g.36549  ORF Transcript_19515/g.36549 Transcript_19515/m.36549 type:complete len:322 (+) Transcript_19515:48-1013(+)
MCVSYPDVSSEEHPSRWGRAAPEYECWTLLVSRRISMFDFSLVHDVSQRAVPRTVGIRRSELIFRGNSQLHDQVVVLDGVRSLRHLHPPVLLKGDVKSHLRPCGNNNRIEPVLRHRRVLSSSHTPRDQYRSSSVERPSALVPLASRVGPLLRPDFQWYVGGRGGDVHVERHDRHVLILGGHVEHGAASGELAVEGRPQHLGGGPRRVHSYASRFSLGPVQHVPVGVVHRQRLDAGPVVVHVPQPSGQLVAGEGVVDGAADRRRDLPVSAEEQDVRDSSLHLGETAAQSPSCRRHILSQVSPYVVPLELDGNRQALKVVQAR